MAGNTITSNNMAGNNKPDNNPPPNWFGDNQTGPGVTGHVASGSVGMGHANTGSVNTDPTTGRSNELEQLNYKKTEMNELGQYNQPSPVQESAENKYQVIDNPLPNKKNKSSVDIFKILTIIILFPFKLIIGTLRLLKNGCILIIALFVILLICSVLILVFKPAFAWNPIKTFLNAGYESPEITDNVDIDGLYYRINIEGLIQTEIILDESELTALYRDYLAMNGLFYVDIEPDNMIYLYNIDTEERPLWLIIDTKQTDNSKFYIESIGFKRFKTPPGMSGFISDTAGSFFNFLEKQVTSENKAEFFKVVIRKYKIDPKIQINDVIINKDHIILIVSNS